MNRIIATLALASLAVLPVLPAIGFSDVDGHPQENAIRRAIADDFFTGYEDGTFRPDQPISDKHVARVFRRAFPDGVTRAEMAAVMVAGQAVLAPSDLADEPAPGGGAQTGEGRLVQASLPVVEVSNFYYSQLLRDGYEPLLRSCHITHSPGNYKTVNNLRNRCHDEAKNWKAAWGWTPPGFDRSNLFVWANDSEGERVRLPFAGRDWLQTGIDDLTPLMVRDVPGRKVDTLMSCVRYAAWSEEKVKTEDDIPRWNCLTGERIK